MTNIKFFLLTLLCATTVGAYQLPQIDIYLNKQSTALAIPSSIVDKAHAIQQEIENHKFMMWANLIQNPNSHTAISTTKSSQPELKEDRSNSLPSSSNETTEKYASAAKSKCTTEAKCVILLMGDSVMGDIGRALQRAVKKEKLPWIVVDAHKVSSGLSVPSYYDWVQTSQSLMTTYKPNMALMLLGTNDAQGIKAETKDLRFGTAEWEENYKAKLNNLVTALTTESAQNWFVIKTFKMKDPGFDKRIKTIRELQEQTIPGEHLLSLQEVLENDKGALDLSLRAPDGIHLSVKGADKIVNDSIKPKMLEQ